MLGIPALNDRWKQENNFLMQKKKKKCFHVYVKVTGIQAQAKGQKTCLGSMRAGNPRSGSSVCVCVKVLLFKTRWLPSHVYKNLGYKQNQLV